MYSIAAFSNAAFERRLAHIALENAHSTPKWRWTVTGFSNWNLKVVLVRKPVRSWYCP